MSLFDYSLHERRDWRLRTIGLIERLIRQRLSNLYGRILDRTVLARIGEPPERQLEGLFREALLEVAGDTNFPQGVKTIRRLRAGSRRKK